MAFDPESTAEQPLVEFGGGYFDGVILFHPNNGGPIITLRPDEDQMVNMYQGPRKGQDTIVNSADYPGYKMKVEDRIGSFRGFILSAAPEGKPKLIHVIPVEQSTSGGEGSQDDAVHAALE